MRLKERILKEYAKVRVVHPTYQSIANKMGCNVTYVWKVVKIAKKQKNLTLGQI